MKIDIEIQNYKQVSENFKRRAKDLPTALQRAVSKVTLLVERYGKLYSPVRTGRMRASIIPININKVTASVGPQVSYAPYVHRRVPFMYAARQSTLPQVGRMFNDEIKIAIK